MFASKLLDVQQPIARYAPALVGYTHPFLKEPPAEIVSRCQDQSKWAIFKVCG